MKTQFEIVFLREAIDFMSIVDPKARNKIYYNLDKARYGLDPRLFKKLNSHIWEFRSTVNNNQYRLFAFWDKSDDINTLVICTHGLIKKTSSIPAKEIKKAEEIRKRYFNTPKP